MPTPFWQPEMAPKTLKCHKNTKKSQKPGLRWTRASFYHRFYGTIKESSPLKKLFFGHNLPPTQVEKKKIPKKSFFQESENYDKGPYRETC